MVRSLEKSSQLTENFPINNYDFLFAIKSNNLMGNFLSKIDWKFTFKHWLEILTYKQSMVDKNIQPWAEKIGQGNFDWNTSSDCEFKLWFCMISKTQQHQFFTNVDYGRPLPLGICLDIFNQCILRSSFYLFIYHKYFKYMTYSLQYTNPLNYALCFVPETRLIRFEVEYTINQRLQAWKTAFILYHW